MTLCSKRSLALVLVPVAAVAAMGLVAGTQLDRASAAPAPQNNKTLMIAVVAPAVKPIWDLGYADKVTDADWANLKKAAADLNNSMAMVVSGGPIAAEQTRAKSPKWQEWAKKTADAAAAAVRAVNAKNQMQLAAAGDTLVETCEGCHMAFDPTAR